MKQRTGTFQKFKDYTVASAGGEHRVDPREPKIWCELDVRPQDQPMRALK